MSQSPKGDVSKNDPIINILQTHPTNRKDNLIKIAEALGIEYVAKDRKTELLLKIEKRLNEEPEDEPTVREIAAAIQQEHEQAKASKRTVRGDSQSACTLDRSPLMVINAPSPTEADPATQDLFDDSVLSDAADLSTARKTLFFPTRHDAGSTDPRANRDKKDTDNIYEIKKLIERQQNAITDLISTINDERRARAKEQEQYETHLSSLNGVLSG